jgi:hypothetical protein
VPGGLARRGGLIPAPVAPSEEQTQLMAARADLHAAYTRALVPLSPALLVGAVGARVALAPSSDAAGALAATVETWIILGRGGQRLHHQLGNQLRRQESDLQQRQARKQPVPPGPERRRVPSAARPVPSLARRAVRATRVVAPSVRAGGWSSAAPRASHDG